MSERDRLTAELAALRAALRTAKPKAPVAPTPWLHAPRAPRDHNAARVIYACKCGQAKTWEYTARRGDPGVNRQGWPTSGKVLAWVRTTPEGRQVRREDDAHAPCVCGRRMEPREVQGSVTTTKCGAKCRSSKGPSCECACGGANHGAGFEATPRRNPVPTASPYALRELFALLAAGADLFPWMLANAPDGTLGPAWEASVDFESLLELTARTGDRRALLRGAVAAARTALWALPPGERRPAEALEIASDFARGRASLAQVATHATRASEASEEFEGRGRARDARGAALAAYYAAAIADARTSADAAYDARRSARFTWEVASSHRPTRAELAAIVREAIGTVPPLSTVLR